MTALTQTITALFICLLPRLWKMFTRQNEKSIEVKETFDVAKIIEQYCKSYIHERVQCNTHEDINPTDIALQDLDQSINKYLNEEDLAE